MNRSLTRGLLLVTLVLAACDRASIPQEPALGLVPTQQMIGTVSRVTDGAPDAVSNVLVGRTLALEVGTRGWDENLGSTAYYGFGAQPVASTVIDAASRYTLTLPDLVPAASLAPVTGFWTTTPFKGGACSVQTQQYSDPAMRLGLGTLRVLAGGALTDTGNVGWPLVFRSTEPVRDYVMQGLVYADRAGTVNVRYDCVNEFGTFTMKSDTQLALRAGWNVLVRRTMLRGGLDGMFAYETRSRPVAATGETLVYLGDALYLDIP
ncbi:hypothetical protein HLB42_20270 (plasmid) [Deinococcus sp. D7000]|nr:hypothetical protein HLB42_20270 [Deinococcus sp. D7000]